MSYALNFVLENGFVILGEGQGELLYIASSSNYLFIGPLSIELSQLEHHVC